MAGGTAGAATVEGGVAAEIDSEDAVIVETEDAVVVAIVEGEEENAGDLEAQGHHTTASI